MSDNPYAPPQSKPETPDKTSAGGSVARFLIQIFWIGFITLGSMGLITLVVVSSISEPIEPGQLGYATGRYTLWVFIAAIFLVRFAAVRGWLPGVPAKKNGSDDTGDAA